MQRKHSRRHYARKIAREVVEHPANRRHRLRALGRAVRWQVLKHVGDGVRDVPYEGFVLRCYPDSASASNVWYFTARYDWDEMALLERLLRPGDAFLDLGANIGTYTLLAASLVDDRSRLVAVEPLPRAATRLRENLTRNGLDEVVVHEVAVDDHAGTIGFLDFDVSSVADHDTDRRGRAAFPVAAARIDELVDLEGIGAAKLDVEGLELRALRGAEGLLARRDPPVWIVELMDWQLAKHGAGADELVAFMADHGFAPHAYDADEARLDPDPAAWTGRDNVVFVARDRHDEVVSRLTAGGPGSARAAPPT